MERGKVKTRAVSEFKKYFTWHGINNKRTITALKLGANESGRPSIIKKVGTIGVGLEYAFAVGAKAVAAVCHIKPLVARGQC